MGRSLEHQDTRIKPKLWEPGDKMQPPEDLRCVSLRGGAVGLKLERGRSEHLLSWKQERDSAAEGKAVSSRKMERSMPQMLFLVSMK